MVLDSFAKEVFGLVSSDAADLADSGPVLFAYNHSVETRSKACQKKIVKMLEMILMTSFFFPL